ncbi:MAG: hypothetical protein AB1625_04135 [Acidobacteriota bacterium]
MNTHRALVVCAALICLVPARADEPAAPAPREPGPDEAVVFEDVTFGGASLLLKVGDELPNLTKTPEGNWDQRISSLKVGADAIVVLYSWFDFGNVCLGLPGTGTGGSGRFADLSRIKPKNLRFHLGDRARSLRVVAKGADISKLCR